MKKKKAALAGHKTALGKYESYEESLCREIPMTHVCSLISLKQCNGHGTLVLSCLPIFS